MIYTDFGPYGALQGHSRAFGHRSQRREYARLCGLLARAKGIPEKVADAALAIEGLKQEAVNRGLRYGATVDTEHPQRARCPKCADERRAWLQAAWRGAAARAGGEVAADFLRVLYARGTNDFFCMTIARRT
jgi:hypothetical protein